MEERTDARHGLNAIESVIETVIKMGRGGEGDKDGKGGEDDKDGKRKRA